MVYTVLLVSRKYKPAKDGEWLWPQRRGYRLECCDCGLIHVVNFRLVKTPNGGRAIQFQAFRDNRATGQVRRHKSRQ